MAAVESILRTNTMAAVMLKVKDAVIVLVSVASMIVLHSMINNASVVSVASE